MVEPERTPPGILLLTRRSGNAAQDELLRVLRGGWRGERHTDTEGESERQPRTPRQEALLFAFDISLACWRFGLLYGVGSTG